MHCIGKPAPGAQKNPSGQIIGSFAKKISDFLAKVASEKVETFSEGSSVIFGQ
jgi:hypothetical protein